MGVLLEFLVPFGPLYGELAKLSTPLLIVVGTAAFIVVTVVVNVLQQLLLRDPTKPPVVFHFFPFFGSTVTYGMDPYAFFAGCKEKVCWNPNESITVRN
jgi:hypothetical protein